MIETLLTKFEETGKEVYEITKQEWEQIAYNHHLKVDPYFYENLVRIEAISFHYDQVRTALEKGLTVPEEVLKDYKELKEQIKKKKAEYEKIPLVTKEVMNLFNEGDRITLNKQYKLTVYKKTENTLILKLYRSKTKGIEVKEGDRYYINIGWKEAV